MDGVDAVISVLETKITTGPHAINLTRTASSFDLEVVLILTRYDKCTLAVLTGLLLVLPISFVASIGQVAIGQSLTTTSNSISGDLVFVNRGEAQVKLRKV